MALAHGNALIPINTNTIIPLLTPIHVSTAKYPIATNVHHITPSNAYNAQPITT